MPPPKQRDSLPSREPPVAEALLEVPVAQAHAALAAPRPAIVSMPLASPPPYSPPVHGVAVQLQAPTLPSPAVAPTTVAVASSDPRIYEVRDT